MYIGAALYQIRTTLINCTASSVLNSSFKPKLNVDRKICL